MQAVTVKCPECGGLLNVADGTGVAVKCQYCGATARIQRRTMMQMPAQMPPMHAGDPRQIARQVVPRGKVIGILMIPTVLVIGVVVMSFVGASRSSSHSFSFAITPPTGMTTSSSGRTPAADPPNWKGGPPLVQDVDGDGSDDLIGVRRYVQGDKMALMAVSGKDAKILWETPSLGTFNDVYQNRLALAGGIILRGDLDANLLGYAANDGRALWKTAMGEVVDGYCAGPEGAILVGTADKKWWTVTVATGAKSAAPARKRTDRCGLLQVVTHEDVTNLEILEGAVTVPEMSVRQVLAHGSGAPNIAVGYKHPGTAVALLAGISGKTVAWKVEVPASDPLRSKLWGVDHVALDPTHVAVYYEYQSAPSHVTLFDRATGTRVWDVVVPKPQHGSHNISGFALTNDLVVLATYNGVMAYERATGKQRWVF